LHAPQQRAAVALADREHFSPRAEISRTARELKSNMWIEGRFHPPTKLVATATSLGESIS